MLDCLTLFLSILLVSLYVFLSICLYCHSVFTVSLSFCLSVSLSLCLSVSLSLCLSVSLSLWLSIYLNVLLLICVFVCFKLTWKAKIFKVVHSGGLNELDGLEVGLGRASVVVRESTLKRYVVVFGAAAHEVALKETSQKVKKVSQKVSSNKSNDKVTYRVTKNLQGCTLFIIKFTVTKNTFKMFIWLYFINRFVV